MSEIESNILEFWKKHECFKRQNEIAKERRYPAFNFLNGPPFVSGNLHHGHLFAGSAKDAITRFWAMNGRFVERVATLDCLGLPAELHTQKLIGCDVKDYVEQHGIGAFNDICYKEAIDCSSGWVPLMDKVGFWLDFDKKIMTMDPSYMETVWSVIADLYNKDLIYRSFKVMPFSTGCQTTLSKTEAGMNYKDVTDKSVIIKFKLRNTTINPMYNNINILIWTTTIWSLVSNLAVCVNPNLNYCVFFLNGERHIALKSWVERQQQDLQKQIKKKKKTSQPINLEIEDEFDEARIFNIKFTQMHLNIATLMTNQIYIMETIKGNKLTEPHFQYEPLFDYFSDAYPTAFRILSDDYVKEDSGCGCVHIAPAHGEDDYRVCIEHGIINPREMTVPCPIDEFGKFTNEVPFIAGVYFKDAEAIILKKLKER